ncbi:hypothetical protein DPMN_076321 [Dreissena polymorpha]|uniref:Uncharacterized protein n=1 Tax=Dreissena polymorpha TaxID=45954 RepID=A0A9D3YIV3_DREPO|nr:hypothetical protein DPMN_076321 [Dreissena polymorpha]
MEFLMQDVNDVIKEQHTRPVNDLHMPVLQKIINLMTLRKRSGSGQTRQNRRENAAALLKNFISIMSSMSQGGTELPMYSE